VLAVAGERVGHGGHERDGVTLEVAVVDPDRVEAGIARPARPVDDIVRVVAGGQADADRPGEGAHLVAPGGALLRSDDRSNCSDLLLRMSRFTGSPPEPPRT